MEESAESVEDDREEAIMLIRPLKEGECSWVFKDIKGMRLKKSDRGAWCPK